MGLLQESLMRALDLPNEIFPIILVIASPRGGTFGCVPLFSVCAPLYCKTLCWASRFCTGGREKIQKFCSKQLRLLDEAREVGHQQHPGPENRDSQHMLSQPRRFFLDLYCRCTVLPAKTEEWPDQKLFWRGRETIWRVRSPSLCLGQALQSRQSHSMSLSSLLSSTIAWVDWRLTWTLPSSDQLVNLKTIGSSSHPERQNLIECIRSRKCSLNIFSPKSGKYTSLKDI